MTILGSKLLRSGLLLTTFATLLLGTVAPASLAQSAKVKKLWAEEKAKMAELVERTTQQSAKCQSKYKGTNKPLSNCIEKTLDDYIRGECKIEKGLRRKYSKAVLAEAGFVSPESDKCWNLLSSGIELP